MSGPEKVTVATVRCTSYSCRRTYGPNFYIEQSAKINTLPNVDAAGEAIFISPKVGFTVTYLRYHMLLEFRAFASARAALDCSGGGHFREVHGSAIMYFIVLSQYPAASIPMSFAIGHEVTSQSIEAYDQYVHNQAFPPSNKRTIHEIVCDGHAKVHVKCTSLHKKHPGKPRANGKRKPYGYGWFMAVDPRTLRVLGVSCLHQPEGNEVMDGILTRLLPKYPKLDGVVLDRACYSFLPYAKRTKKFPQVAHWCVDYFHGAKHSDRCP